MNSLSSYRFVNLVNGRYQAWVSSLDGKSGVYAIRSLPTGRTLYIGDIAHRTAEKDNAAPFPGLGWPYSREPVRAGICGSGGLY